MKRHIAARMFDPPWWYAFVSGQYLPRRALRDAMMEFGPLLEGRIADVGCGTRPYEHLLTGAHSVTGIELDTVRARAAGFADVYYDGRTLPFDAAAFDGVICNQVLEHVADPTVLLDEINRILTLSGMLLLTTPFVWAEHERPHDYRRFTSLGLAKLLMEAGFEPLHQRKLLPGSAGIAALAAEHLNSKYRDWPGALRIGARALTVAPFSIAGRLMQMAAPNGKSEFYLDNLILARKR